MFSEKPSGCSLDNKIVKNYTSRITLEKETNFNTNYEFTHLCGNNRPSKPQTNYKL